MSAIRATRARAQATKWQVYIFDHDEHFAEIKPIVSLQVGDSLPAAIHERERLGQHHALR